MHSGSVFSMRQEQPAFNIWFRISAANLYLRVSKDQTLQSDGKFHVTRPNLEQKVRTV